MKKIKLLFVSILFIPASTLFAQTGVPAFVDVLEKFIKEYAFTAKPTEKLNFSKKKTGWYAEVLDLTQNEKVTISELFWSKENNRFNALRHFKLLNPNYFLYIDFTRFLQEFDAYHYERCQYYGYHDWDEDMIKDFGGSIPKNDTLLEGLARAYSAYAGRYSWFQAGGLGKPGDSLQQKLDKLARPSPERLEKIRYYSTKAIELYETLLLRNPRYLTKLGNTSAELFNEQMTLYTNLCMTGQKKEAKEFISSIKVSQPLKQIAYNYLGACLPNSILLTDDDNHTYPLWYVQETEGYRKDVAVLNYPLLRFIPYVAWEKDKGSVSFSTTLETLGSPDFDYFYKDPESINKGFSLFLKDFISIIQKREYKYENEVNQTIACYPADKLNFPVDSIRFRNIYKKGPFAKNFEWRLPGYLLLNDFLIFDMLETNFNTRPFYFINSIELFDEYSNMQEQAGIYRLIPHKFGIGDYVIIDQVEKLLENYLTTVYKPVNDDIDKGSYYFGYGMDDFITRLYHRVIQYYVGKNDVMNGKIWSRKYLNNFKGRPIPYCSNLVQISVSLMRSGLNTEGIMVLEKMGEYIMKFYRSKSVIHPYPTRELALTKLKDCLQTLTARKLDSKKLRSIIKQVETGYFISDTDL